MSTQQDTKNQAPKSKDEPSSENLHWQVDSEEKDSPFNEEILSQLYMEIDNLIDSATEPVAPAESMMRLLAYLDSLDEDAQGVAFEFAMSIAYMHTEDYRRSLKKYVEELKAGTWRPRELPLSRESSAACLPLTQFDIQGFANTLSAIRSSKAIPENLRLNLDERLNEISNLDIAGGTDPLSPPILLTWLPRLLKKSAG
ncbi:MAG: hypothetical protein HY231_21800 [Acidobacteria bacterium]|nr:hypothetical protein [Acidobacteriota bacterium]